jgi:hypothetical protein
MEHQADILQFMRVLSSLRLTGHTYNVHLVAPQPQELVVESERAERTKRFMDGLRCCVYLDHAQAYIQGLGFNNVNNRQQIFAVNRLKQDNSFYSPSTKQISYGRGPIARSGDDGRDAGKPKPADFLLLLRRESARHVPPVNFASGACKMFLQQPVAQLAGRSGRQVVQQLAGLLPTPTGPEYVS